MDQPDFHNKDAPELPHLPLAFPPQVEDLEQDKITNLPFGVIQKEIVDHPLVLSKQ